MDGKFWAQCLKNNRYLINGDITATVNNEHLPTMSGTGLGTSGVFIIFVPTTSLYLNSKSIYFITILAKSKSKMYLLIYHTFKNHSSSRKLFSTSSNYFLISKT